MKTIKFIRKTMLGSIKTPTSLMYILKITKKRKQCSKNIFLVCVHLLIFSRYIKFLKKTNYINKQTTCGVSLDPQHNSRVNKLTASFFQWLSKAPC